MRTRDHIGLTLGPLVLRIALGFVFVWAGYGKWIVKDFEGEQAARLVNELKWAQWAPAETDASAESDDATATDDQAETPEATDEGADDATDEAAEVPEDDAGQEEAQAAPVVETGKVRARGLLGLAVMLEDAKMPYPRILAWLAMITELVGGALILIGMMTRFWSIGLAITMGMAFYLTMWETVCAKIEGLAYTEWYGALSTLGHPTLNTAFLQVSLCAIAVALLFMGPGSFSVDRIFGSGPGSCPRCDRRKLDEAGKASANAGKKG
ncbi:MAG: DoxX family membrane protein [Planctomycetes bacterium]|nr:DoxX family membrane protein [Planctomycetota bacterium]